jgi:hypothetical protein
MLRRVPGFKDSLFSMSSFFLLVVATTLLSQCDLIQAENSRKCIANPVDKHAFSCVEESTASGPILAALLASLDRGVAQRIDGTEREKNSISEVLRRMDEYFLNEVLVYPEYEITRNQW